MPTLNQLLKRSLSRKVIKKKGTRSKALNFRPQRKGVCYKVTRMTPKKPNSALRRVVKVNLMYPNGRITCYVPGIGGGAKELKIYSQVLVRGGHVCDLPGVQYHVIRGKFDLSWFEEEEIKRVHARSKYGIPKDLTKIFYKS